MAGWRDQPISEPQKKFARGLVDRITETAATYATDPGADNNVTIGLLLPEHEARLWVNLDNITKGQAGELIDALKILDEESTKLAKQAKAQAVATRLKKAKTDEHGSTDGGASKHGGYFIIDPTDGVEKFIHVTLEVRASDVLYPISDPVRRNAILTAIAKDPINAINEYGIRLEVCGVCGRTLTNKDSRLKGIGPICAQKFSGIATPEDLDMLAQLGLIDSNE